MIKYVVIDMSKLDMDKLSEMLTKAYEEGYKEGIKDYNYINAPTIPYNGDILGAVTDYTTITNAINVNDANISATPTIGTNTITFANSSNPLKETL